jgi:4-hydroxy-2-oxoheptanedioate aldolase
MDLPVNTFKRALGSGKPQYGLWLGLPDTSCAEICAGAGFDWLCIDTEHSPFDLRSVLAHLQTITAYRTHPIVRPVDGNRNRIKKLLDIGAQTLLVPMVDTAEQAAELVRAVRYPPNGVRGLGTSTARASRWNRIPNYAGRASEEICLIVQAESTVALDNLAAIAAVDGVDSVFIGPSDLSASMGHLGQPQHPEVVAAIDTAIETLRAAGKAAGIFALDPAMARRYVEQGAAYVAVGADTLLLANAARALAQEFRRSG